MAGVEAKRGKKRRRTDDEDQEMTRNEIEAALKECILRLGYEALKTEQESANISFVEGNNVFICLWQIPLSVTFAFPAFLIF